MYQKALFSEKKSNLHPLQKLHKVTKEILSRSDQFLLSFINKP